MLTEPTRRMPQVLTLSVTALMLVVGFVVGFVAPASAEPGEDGGATQAQLREAVKKATTEYDNAKGRLDASVARQTQTTDQLTKTQARLAELEASVGTVAAAAYRGERMNMAMAVLDSKSPEGMLHAALTVQYLVTRDDRQLHEYIETRTLLQEQQKQIAAEIELQKQQLAVMAKNKKAAEDALRRAGGGATTSGAPSGGRVTTSAVPRNSDGSYPAESCSLKDPTPTGGCVTWRMNNAYWNARNAGYARYTRCWRSGGGGDHPIGKACDFSANATGFQNVRASGGDKAYGDALAAWCVANASRLGVSYVIWYDRIWQSSTGWRSYGGAGTVAGDHYNHVHLSMH